MQVASIEETTPPTSHVLRPHHVSLLTVFMLTFKEPEVTKALPPPFVLHIYRVLLSEVSEIAQPKSHQEFLRDFATGPRADAEESRRLIVALRMVHNDLKTADQMTSFFNSVPALFMEKHEDDDPPIFIRRSIFGYFCRRCFVSFIKLSFSGVIKLQKDYESWCEGNLEAGYEPVQKGNLSNDKLIFRTQADRKAYAQPDSFAAWEKGYATGDENLATENLRRFFEQHFHEQNDSGVRQHALLNLVRMHYIRGEYVAARKLLQEAITVSRTGGDKLTLQHCISLLHRLPQAEAGRKPTLNEIQPDLNPLEVLFDVSKLMQLQNEQPLSASFERVVQAAGLYDLWIETHSDVAAEYEQWGQHTVQAILWAAAGSDQLAAAEENIVTAFTAAGCDDHNRLVVSLNRAYKTARQGKYHDALAMLLDPDVWRGINMADYVQWANQIWHIFVLRASRRGQDRLCREFLLPRRPPGLYNAREYFFDAPVTVPFLIRDPLYEVMQMRACGQFTAAVEQLLTALWHSEFQCRMGLYRTGIIFLADIGLEFGMTKRCRSILQEIMPQIINGNDIEQRALGCFVFARCIIAAEDNKEDGLHAAIPYLTISETDFDKLQMYRSLADVQYLLSVAYHNLNLEDARDQAARRHLTTDELRKRLEVDTADSEVTTILQLVTQVGVALTAR